MIRGLLIAAWCLSCLIVLTLAVVLIVRGLGFGPFLIGLVLFVAAAFAAVYGVLRSLDHDREEYVSAGAIDRAIGQDQFGEERRARLERLQQGRGGKTA